MSEEVELQQAAVETTPEQAAQQPETAPETQTDVDTTAQAKEDEDEHRVPKGVQKRIDRLTQEKYRLRAELDFLRGQQQQPQQAQPAQQAQQPSQAPKLEQYNSIEEYLDALADHKASQKFDHLAKEREAKESQTRQQQEVAKLHESYTKQTEQARQAYGDFDDVVQDPDLPISQAMAEAIMRSTNGADVAYYLGKNPDQAARIASLDPFSAAVEIGRIAATIVRPQPRKTSNAPPPIQPVGARATPVTDPDKMSADEWIKWRNGQLKKR